MKQKKLTSRHTSITTLLFEISPPDLRFLSIDPGSTRSGIFSTYPPIGIQIINDKNAKWLTTITGFLLWNFKYEKVIIEDFWIYQKYKELTKTPITIGKIIQLCEFFNTPYLNKNRIVKKIYQIPKEHISDAANLLGKWLMEQGIIMEIKGWKEI